MLTKHGLIKKTALEEFGNVRKTGIIAINLKSEDALRWVMPSGGKDELVTVTAKGQSIRFKESDVRPMGRTASGVTAIKLKKEDEVAGLGIIKGNTKAEGERRLLIVTSNGFAKQTKIKEYKIQNRGGSGIKTAKVTPKTGIVIAARILGEEDEEMIAFSSKGQAIRTELKNIRVAGRDTQGVRVMNLKSGDKLVGTVCL